MHSEGKLRNSFPFNRHLIKIIVIYRLAMKHHPDRFTNPEEKKAAKTKFQSISSAYSVLRDGMIKELLIVPID